MYELEITSAQLARMLAHAEAARPEEACGMLLGIRDGESALAADVVPSPNCHLGDRRRAFQIEGEALAAAHFRARQEGREVLGFYHSHPAALPSPSASDLEAAWPRVSHLVLGREPGGDWLARSWRRAVGGERFEEESLRVRERASR